MSYWGFTIKWGSESMSASGFRSHADMLRTREEEFWRMEQRGWTQPRWWQFWRAGDTRK